MSTWAHSFFGFFFFVENFQLNEVSKWLSEVSLYISTVLLISEPFQNSLC